MASGSLARMAATLALAAAGAALVQASGLAAGLLIGASVVVAAAAAAGMDTRLPDALRNGALAALGLSLGSGVNPGFFGLIADYWQSFILLILCVIAIIAVNAVLLVRVFAIRPSTAIVGTAPGALSMTMALAFSGFGEVRGVAVLQSFRVFLIVTALPLLMSLSGAQPAPASPAMPLPLAGFLALGVIAGLAGLVLWRVGAPAPFLLSGMAASALGHGMDLVHGGLHPYVLTAAMIVVGAQIGGRFRGVTRAELARFGLASLAATAIAVLLAVLFAYAASLVTGGPFPAFFIAYAPGGVEAMAALAIALGYNPALVAAHHIFRIIILMIGLPLSVAYIRRRWPQMENGG